MSSQNDERPVNHLKRYGLAIIVMAVILSASVLTAIYLRTAATVACEGQQVWEGTPPPSIGYIPVLLMRPGSSGYICVNYQSIWYGLNDSSLFSRFKNLTWTFSLSIMKCTNTTSHLGWQCASIGSQSFYTNAFPRSIQINRNIQTLTVLYTIEPLPNSTGFYDYVSYGQALCDAMPMAVGYSASQVNSSDFAPRFVFLGCNVLSQPFLPVSLSISDMSVTYDNFTF